MKFKCKKCGAEYEYLDIYYNGNGDGKRFISCDECNAITIIDFADYYHGWRPNRDELIIMEVADSTFDEVELKPNQKKAIKWIDDEENGFYAGFYSFIEDEDGTLIQCGDYTPMYSESTFEKDVDFNRCMSERGVKVYWNGYEDEIMSRAKENKKKNNKSMQETNGKVILHDFCIDVVDKSLNDMEKIVTNYRNNKKK